MSQLLETLIDKERFVKSVTFFKHIWQKAWENGIPLMGTFELTPRCNLDCKMCYVRLDKSQMKQNELTTNQWISIIEKACDEGMMFATLTGGECFLHPGFKQIYEYLQSRGIFVSIFTNGTLFNKEIVDWLIDKPPRMIQISVYGSSTEEYEIITGGGDAFYKVDEAINLIKESGILFTLAITVSRQLTFFFNNILEYCKSKEPLRCDVGMHLIEAREETNRKYDNYSPSLDQQIDVFKIRFKSDGQELIQYSCEDELFEKNNILKNNISKCDNINIIKGIDCKAGRNSFSISWEGRMLACNTFPFAESYPLIDGFLNAWHYINKCSSEYIMPVECLNCAYKKVCPHCPAVHWLGAGEGHCNLRICKESKRYALEGIGKL